MPQGRGTRLTAHRRSASGDVLFRSTLGGMADDEDATQYFRRLRRRQYLTEHEQERWRQAKAEGARRIDVTLTAKALDDYAIVRSYLKGLNRIMAERNMGPPFRLSAAEVVAMALSYAAAVMLEEDDREAKAGHRRPLAE
jgi:hypothetical protein